MGRCLQCVLRWCKIHNGCSVIQVGYKSPSPQSKVENYSRQVPTHLYKILLGLMDVLRYYGVKSILSHRNYTYTIERIPLKCNPVLLILFFSRLILVLIHLVLLWTDYPSPTTFRRHPVSVGLYTFLHLPVFDDVNSVAPRTSFF